LRKTSDIKVNVYSPLYSAGEREGEAAPWCGAGGGKDKWERERRDCSKRQSGVPNRVFSRRTTLEMYRFVLLI